MRCPDCNKFVSYEGDEEPVIDSDDISEDGDISLEVTITKNCGECGSEIAQMSLTLGENVDLGEHHGKGHEITLEVEDPTQTERYETTYYDRRAKKRKPIKSPRYYRHYFGVEVPYTVKCSCGEDITSGTLSTEDAASSLESLY